MSLDTLDTFTSIRSKLGLKRRVTSSVDAARARCALLPRSWARERPRMPPPVDDDDRMSAQ